MSTVKVINSPIGYFDSTETMTFSQNVICEEYENNKTILEIFGDLCPDPGEYNYTFEYDGSFITITYGNHKPIGMPYMKIDYSWLENDKKRMNNWSFKNRIINKI